MPPEPSLPNLGRCASLVLALLVCACATPEPSPTAPADPGRPPQRTSSAAPGPSTPDPTRVYADLLSRTEDLPSVVRTPKAYDGRNVVLYGLRGGDLRPIEGRFSMPLSGTDGRPAVVAIDRPSNNQFYLLLGDDFAREARERKMLAGARAPMLIECTVAAQTAGRITSYPCEVTSLVLVSDNRITDMLWRARDRKLEYFRY